jgi:photosystem II stability/assembly factor-like uncharacterized protein
LQWREIRNIPLDAAGTSVYGNSKRAILSDVIVTDGRYLVVSTGTRLVVNLNLSTGVWTEGTSPIALGYLQLTQDGFLSGVLSYLPMKVYGSSDYGKTWMTMGESGSIMNPPASKQVFADSKTGYIIRRDLFSGGGGKYNMWRTKDGGVTWEKQKEGVPSDSQFWLSSDKSQFITRGGRDYVATDKFGTP